MSLPDKCPLCCAHVLVEWDGKQRKSERSATFECQTSIYAGQAPRQTQSRWCEVREREYLAARVAELERDLEQAKADRARAAMDARNPLLARVAELEALVREAEESNANALARLSAAEARIELRRLENEAVRRQLGHAENACDAMEKRLAALEARCRRLEDAALEVYLDCIASDHLWSEKETRNMHALRDVLEAKP